MRTKDDYRVENIERVNFDGPKVTFKAFQKQGNAFVFVGTFTASAATPEDHLWAVADAKLRAAEEE